MTGTVAHSLLATLLLTGSLWADSASPQEKITFDRYYTIELQGRHCGYARTTVRESPEQLT